MTQLSNDAAARVMAAIAPTPQSVPQQPLTLAQKTAGNVWDHLDDVLPVIEAARRGEWAWFYNHDFKYLELRIDMRDGGCLVKDRNGKRRNPSDAAAQRRRPDDFMNCTWADNAIPLAAWQLEQVVGAPAEGTDIPLGPVSTDMHRLARLLFSELRTLRPNHALVAHAEAVFAEALRTEGREVQAS